jgi:hypothetical protein
MSDYFGPRTPPGTVFSSSSDPDVIPVKLSVEENRDLRAILTDLIAESRLWLSGDNPVPLGLVLDRAETRLLDTGD